MSTIKFLHLAIGQQFEFRGQNYTKVAPLIASNNDKGTQKMIPRSALVSVQGGGSATTDTKQTEQHPALAVLERYHQAAHAEMKSLSNDEAKIGAARARLNAIKAELEKAIQKP